MNIAMESTEASDGQPPAQDAERVGDTTVVYDMCLAWCRSMSMGS